MTGDRPQLPPTPELDRRADLIATGRPEAVGGFLDWLGEHGYVIARWEEFPGEGEQLVPAHVRPEKLLADHFGIDLQKVETEQRAILEAISAHHGLTVREDRS